MPKAARAQSSTGALDEEKPYAAIGARLRALRKLGRLNQPRLSQMTGIDQAAISRYERGVRRITLEDAHQYVGKFRVTLDFIFYGSPHGLPEEVAALLRVYCPEVLGHAPSRKADRTDTALASYRASLDDS